MKHFLFILIILFSLLSCSNSDDNKTELSIVGSWMLSESKLNGEDITTQSVIRLIREDSSIEFRYLNPSGQDVRIETGNWSMIGNELTIDFDNENSYLNNYTITELTMNSMKWEAEFPDVGTLKETLTKQ